VTVLQKKWHSVFQAAQEMLHSIVFMLTSCML